MILLTGVRFRANRPRYLPRWVDRLLFPDNWPSADHLNPALVRDLRPGDNIPDGRPCTAHLVIEQQMPDCRCGNASCWPPRSRRDATGRRNATTHLHLAHDRPPPAAPLPRVPLDRAPMRGPVPGSSGAEGGTPVGGTALLASLLATTQDAGAEHLTHAPANPGRVQAQARHFGRKWGMDCAERGARGI